MHPAANRGASLGFTACRTGTYHLAGAFARANDFQFAGDGVTVAVVRNLDTTNLIFTGDIPASAEVDTTNLFQGPGVAAFDLTLSLIKGDAVRFVVFSGTNDDNGFDATALSFTLIRDPVPLIQLHAARGDNNLVIDWSSLPGESYELLSAPIPGAWKPIAQLTSTGTNHLWWPNPFTNNAQFFRVELLP